MDNEKARQLAKLSAIDRLKIFFSSKYTAILTVAVGASFVFGIYTAVDQRLLKSESVQYQARARLAQADVMIIKIERQLRENQDKIIEVGNYIRAIRQEALDSDAHDKTQRASNAEKYYNKLLDVSKSTADLENYLRFYREILMFREFSFNLFTSAAQASQAKSDMTITKVNVDSVKPYILIVVFAVTTIILLLSALTFCFAKDPEKIKASDNAVRTIVGFYMGIATGMLGLPSP